MKKLTKQKLVILMLLFLVLPLTACNPGLTNTEISPEQIEKNLKAWNKKTKDAEIVPLDSTGGDGTLPAKKLYKAGDAVIKGKVYNLEKMASPKNMVYTKVTIHVDEVISGDSQLVGKTIYTMFRGGLTTSNVLYEDTNQTRIADHKILLQSEEAPLPKIGSEIITAVTHNHLKNYEYDKLLKKSGFTDKNSVSVDDPEYNFWIKTKGAKEFKLNNPKVLNEKSDAHDEQIKYLDKTTSELNHKYNN